MFIIISSWYNNVIMNNGITVIVMPFKFLYYTFNIYFSDAETLLILNIGLHFLHFIEIKIGVYRYELWTSR